MWTANPVQVIALTLSLSIPLGGVGPVTVDITPVLAVPVDSLPFGAVSLPGLLVHDRNTWAFLERADPHTPGGTYAQHELEHARQMAALGPAYWLAYGLTLGEAFEPYSARRGNAATGWHNAYTAPKDAHDYPLLRFRVSEGAVSATFLPGYPSLTGPDPLEPGDAPTVVVAEDWTSDYWDAHYALGVDVSGMLAGAR